MFVIVGLGNPGNQYENTRHNVGFMFLDSIAEESRTSISQNKFNSLTAKFSWQGHDVLIAKPQTYMNLSGPSVEQVLTFYKVEETHLIVVFDDLDQTHGAVKTRFGGGHGGHNGIRSILETLSTDQFYRVKIGIGKPEHKSATVNWVLNKFNDTELETLYKESFPIAKKRILEIMKHHKKK